MCLLYFIGAFIIMAIIAGMAGDLAAIIVGGLIAVLWGVQIARAERKSRLHIIALAGFVLCVVAIASSDWEEWTQQQKAVEAEAALFAFAREHCVVAMETHEALSAKRIELDRQEEQLRLLADADGRRAEAVEDALERNATLKDQVDQSLTDIESRLMDMYVIHLEGGDPFSGKPSEAVNEMVSNAKVVLDTIDSMRGAKADVPIAPTPAPVPAPAPAPAVE